MRSATTTILFTLAQQMTVIDIAKCNAIVARAIAIEHLLLTLLDHLFARK